MTKTEKTILDDLQKKDGQFYNNANFLNAALKLQEKNMVCVNWKLTHPERFNFKQCFVTLRNNNNEN